jgi:hypothetical protein
MKAIKLIIFSLNEFQISGKLYSLNLIPRFILSKFF